MKEIRPDQLAVSIEQAGRLLGIGRSTAYSLAKRPASEGGLPTISIAGQLKVSRAALEAMLARAVEEAAAG